MTNEEIIKKYEGAVRDILIEVRDASFAHVKPSPKKDDEVARIEELKKQLEHGK